ncbi:hypothetical protein DICVIV_12553 [Dictyocaulus viviparus]|uniref:Uncharacterized protein n=1 Tax=Dictyocaulus viviparus TaxID=29172 RepID=A0A0D8XCU3_DICVI|nr:hypothetical protein DICVIV_12553 [Dictyocaulus viviparus]
MLQCQIMKLNSIHNIFYLNRKTRLKVQMSLLIGLFGYINPMSWFKHLFSKPNHIKYEQENQDEDMYGEESSSQTSGTGCTMEHFSRKLPPSGECCMIAPSSICFEIVYIILPDDIDASNNGRSADGEQNELDSDLSATLPYDEVQGRSSDQAWGDDMPQCCAAEIVEDRSVPDGELPDDEVFSIEDDKNVMLSKSAFVESCDTQNRNSSMSKKKRSVQEAFGNSQMVVTSHKGLDNNTPRWLLEAKHPRYDLDQVTASSSYNENSYVNSLPSSEDLRSPEHDMHSGVHVLDYYFKSVDNTNLS